MGTVDRRLSGVVQLPGRGTGYFSEGTAALVWGPVGTTLRPPAIAVCVRWLLLC